MPTATLIRPDTDFIKEVLASGGGDLKKCFQCATCSAVCELSPEEAPFPRKQMIEAQWGLKGRLVKDPAIWLCHNCGQCTTHCPRGARPGDVMGALRRQVIKHAGYPAFLAKAVSNPKMWPVLFLLPALIFAAILEWAPKGQPTPELEFANAFPVPVLEILFFALSGIVVLAFALSLRRFVGMISSSGSSHIMLGLMPALALIASHQRFAKCGDGRPRFWGHLLTLWGFMGLGLMGTVVGLGSMAGFIRTPLPFFHPLKIFANICAVVILAGLLLLLGDRVADARKRAGSTYFDWFFLLTLVGVVGTGLGAEILRLLQAGAMYQVYFVHLVLIFALFLYAPYSKFAHLVYRTVAIAAQKAAERRPNVEQTVPVAFRGTSCSFCGPDQGPGEEQDQCSG